LIVDETANEETHRVADQNQARVLSPDTHGYGSALLAGFQAACSDYIVTMDADLSHPPHFLKAMWQTRHEAEIIIASRYTPGGKATMPISRLILSKVLNKFFSRGLNLSVQDMSSGYRMYLAQAINWKTIRGRDFNILQELLVRAVVEGHRIKEIPFDYRPRQHGSSHARVIKFGMAYLRTFGQLWWQRHSANGRAKFKRDITP
jgi:dolichol-phosphate mannosyltransferase